MCLMDVAKPTIVFNFEDVSEDVDEDQKETPMKEIEVTNVANTVKHLVC